MRRKNKVRKPGKRWRVNNQTRKEKEEFLGRRKAEKPGIKEREK